MSLRPLRLTRAAAALSAVLVVGAGMAAGQDGGADDAVPPAIGPHLAAASNFGHGWSEASFQGALALGIDDFRDIIYWGSVETRERRYVFDEVRTTYPQRIAGAGGEMSVTVNWGNALYDGGATPHTYEGRQAFARFVVALLDAHPAITAVEVGNEFNGQNFVKGPVAKTSGDARAKAHFELLRAVHQKVKANFPGVEVVGGAAHSVPAGYLWPLFEMGAGAYMDALALHPYTTPPEQLGPQIEVLRRPEALAAIPLQVTEFGSKDAAKAGGDLIKAYCAMALAGAERAAWYPLNDRGDGYVPLVAGEDGAPTGAGRAYALAERHFAGRHVSDVSPDPFTYACRFGERALVIWGEPRELSLQGEGLRALDAEGAPLSGDGLALSMDAPVVVLGEAPLNLGGNVTLGPQTILADSFHQFAYPERGQKYAPDDPFQRFARQGGRETPLQTMPGQEAAGTVWTPYLGSRFLRPARLTADALVPGGSGEKPIPLVHRYVAPRDQTVALEARWQTGERSQDGVVVRVTKGEEVLSDGPVRGAERLDLPSLAMQKGEALTVAVGPGATARGDVTDYRIVLRRAD